MARDKRTKPCGNCKRSKVKCEYDQSLPCVRCMNIGLASSCLFLLKLPSLQLPLINAPLVPFANTPPPAMLPHPLHVPSHNIYSQSHTPSIPAVQASFHPPAQDSIVKLEQKVESMDSKFNELLKLLHENQTAIRDDRQKNKAQREVHSATPSGQILKLKRSLTCSNDDDYLATKKIKCSDDFRNEVLSMQEAKLLFNFFDQNISQQLFGFELKNFCVEDLWESSPILVCAICTISLIHYPDPSVSSKQATLQTHLQQLCSKIIFEPQPSSDSTVFNTIVALILCSFWLSDSQRFTGLALQLAKEHNFNEIHPKDPKTSLVTHRDRLKLWYLLYILDGQQSMTFHRQALLSASDGAIQNSRHLLLDNSKETKVIEQSSIEETQSKEVIKQNSNGHSKLTDLRLISQVEYNCALDEALKGNAWDLLDPQAFGIPSKSNLELDKWMVSWTVLLAPMNNGTVWLSKSTLIYYNFAKMHINSLALRSLQVNTGESGVIFPKWNQYKFVTDSLRTPEKKTEYDVPAADNEEFVSNTELATQDQAMLNLNIAVSAAQTVLSLVLNDKDILDNLKYVPLHIHIMLYYAAFLLVSAPANLLSGGIEDYSHFKNVFNNLRMTKTLQKKILLNLPTDKRFGDRLLKSLDALFNERIHNLQIEIHNAPIDVPAKAELMNEMSTLQCTYSQVELIPESAEVSSLDSSPQPEKKYAWPASHHGHV